MCRCLTARENLLLPYIRRQKKTRRGVVFDDWSEVGLGDRLRHARPALRAGSSEGVIARRWLSSPPSCSPKSDRNLDSTPSGEILEMMRASAMPRQTTV